MVATTIAVVSLVILLKIPMFWYKGAWLMFPIYAAPALLAGVAVHSFFVDEKKVRFSLFMAKQPFSENETGGRTTRFSARLLGSCSGSSHFQRKRHRFLCPHFRFPLAGKGSDRRPSSPQRLDSFPSQNDILRSLGCFHCAAHLTGPGVVVVLLRVEAVHRRLCSHHGSLRSCSQSGLRHRRNGHDHHIHLPPHRGRLQFMKVVVHADGGI